MPRSIGCQTCNAGELVRRRRYRMSMPVVAIGYILLIPCVIGILVAVLFLVASGGAAKAGFESVDRRAEERLVAAGLPRDVIDATVAGRSITDAQRAALSNDQRRALDDTLLMVASEKLGTAGGATLAGGTSVCLGISSFIGGLLGWLLVMKKKVLQCNTCGAVVAAS